MINKFNKGLFYALLGICSIAHANYRSPSENTELMEDAMSGSAAIAIDASTNFFNPAGLTRIPNQQFVGSIKGVDIDTRFVGTSAGLTGSATSNVSAAVPAMHVSSPLTDKLFFGFSVTSPFGLSTQYPRDSILRFVVTESSLETINVSPSLAYRFNPHLSIGAGPDAQYGKLIANVMFPPPPFPINSLLKNEGTDWALGWHAGALYEFNSNTRVGLNYRSQFRHKFRGQSTYADLFISNTFSATLPLPAITTLSIYHAFNAVWSIMGTIDYTQWSIVKNVALKNSAVLPFVVIPQNFHNTFRYAIGGEYRPHERWILRSGLSYENSPMNRRDISVVLPATDNLVWGVGGHYQVVKTVGLDVGYIHVFSKRATINNTQLGVSTIGKANTSINGLGAQVTWDIV